MYTQPDQSFIAPENRLPAAPYDADEHDLYIAEAMEDISNALESLYTDQHDYNDVVTEFALGDVIGKLERLEQAGESRQAKALAMLKAVETFRETQARLFADQEVGA